MYRMKERIEKLLDEIRILRFKRAGVEELRVKFLGKKGVVTQLFDEFRDVMPEQKKELGQILNKLKVTATAKIEELREYLEDNKSDRKSEFDLTKPGDRMDPGTRHPISIARNEILAIFNKLGYAVAEGPEIEDDWHVFGALNFPPEHPAREMQDKFFISTGVIPVLLRTHTSSVQ